MLTKLEFTIRGAVMTGADLLLVTGILHMAAFAIHEANPDTMRLIPYGAIYFALGALIRLGHQAARTWSLFVVAIGLFGALITFGGNIPTLLQISFIVIDLAVLFFLGWARLNRPEES